MVLETDELEKRESLEFKLETNDVAKKKGILPISEDIHC